jgi:hypothetical protein
MVIIITTPDDCKKEAQVGGHLFMQTVAGRGIKAVLAQG